MAPSATTPLPQLSALEDTLNLSKATFIEAPHPPFLHHLASTILHDLQYQHDWTSLSIHSHSPLTDLPLPRPIVSGLPPRRVYIHPEEQVEILKAEHDTGKSVKQYPEREWVLPTHISEKWSLAKFAEVFDALDTVPLTKEEAGEEARESIVGQQWQGKHRQKRLLLATLHDDSTVVYYIMHDGIVKPRQN